MNTQTQYVADAVFVFAHALHELYKVKCWPLNVTSGLCQGFLPIAGQELLEYMKNVTFTGNKLKLFDVQVLPCLPSIIYPESIIKKRWTIWEIPRINITLTICNTFLCSPGRLKNSREFLLPRWDKHGCHAMILPWSYHTHGETWSRLCHKHGRAAMFLAMAAMIHGMIMVRSSCFQRFWGKNRYSWQLFLKELLPYIFKRHNWLVLEEILPPKLRVSKFERRLLRKNRIFFCDR